MKVSAQILLPTTLGEVSKAAMPSSDAPAEAQFAGLVSAAAVTNDAGLTPSILPANTVAGDPGGELEASLSATLPTTMGAEVTQTLVAAQPVRPTGAPATSDQDQGAAGLMPEPQRSQPVAAEPGAPVSERPLKAEHRRQYSLDLRLSAAANLPQDGKSLPPVTSASLVASDVDPAQLVAVALVQTPEDGEEDVPAPAGQLLPETDSETLLGQQVAPASLAVLPIIDQPAPLATGGQAVVSQELREQPEGSASLEDGAENALPSQGGPVRRDSAPLPADLEQLRGGRAQALAWEAAQQSVLAPRQPAAPQQPKALAEIAIVPAPVAEQREGVSTAQLLAGADLADQSAPKPLRQLRAANQAASSAGKVAAPELNATPLAETFGLTQAAPVNQAGLPVASAAPVAQASLEQLVDRLIEARVAARAERSQIEIAHPDFGKVTLAVGLQANDRLGIDLPGAPQELRQAVGQALAQQGAAQASGQNTGQNGGQGSNQNAGQNGAPRHDGQGQAAMAGGEGSQNFAGHNGDPRRNTQDADNPRLSIFAQSRSAGSDGVSGKPSGGPDTSGRRGVLA